MGPDLRTDYMGLELRTLAADIEALGELVRARVLETSGVDLRWEIRRIGRLQKS